MIAIRNIKNIHLDSVPIDPFWNTGDEKELKMHRIHAYPARFPAFITTRGLAFAKKHEIEPKRIADIFCGCGTVAYEARRNNIDFWGCDINPVATLIAKAKSQKYSTAMLKKYYEAILYSFRQLNRENSTCQNVNDRLQYWYDRRHIEKLSKLKRAIEIEVPVHSNYRKFFLCAFSNILKPTSRWLTKSIKPQVDPQKKPAKVTTAFKDQCLFMIAASEESDVAGASHTEIITANFLDPTIKSPKVDMIITSPPYVTSYEYADLHQLSSLWLGMTNDYRELRQGSIGSLHHIYNFKKDLKRLNNTGNNIVFRLFDRDKSQARSVAKYFLDMQSVAASCYRMLRKKGMVIFVIGNTEYKGVRIDNARHLCESLFESGFAEILATKRKITGKILTPYRDTYGRFSTDNKSRKVYGEEFIIVGRKL